MIFVTHGFASATPNENTDFLSGLFPDEMVVGLNYPSVQLWPRHYFGKQFPTVSKKTIQACPPCLWVPRSAASGRGAAQPGLTASLY